MKIRQTGVGTQLTDGFVNMACAMLVVLGLVYLIMVILFYVLLVLLVIFFALPLVVIGDFVSLAATGCALDLSSIIGLRMLRAIAVTNAIVLLDLAQHKIEADADVRMVLIQGGRTRVHTLGDGLHAAALSGLKCQLKHATDEIGTHVAAVCEEELIARLGLEDIAPDRSGV